MPEKRRYQLYYTKSKLVHKRYRIPACATICSKLDLNKIMLASNFCCQKYKFQMKVLSGPPSSSPMFLLSWIHWCILWSSCLLDCDESLGIMNMVVPDSGITGSSALSMEHLPTQSRLQLFQIQAFRPVGWIPAADDAAPWLKVMHSLPACRLNLLAIIPSHCWHG